MPDAGSTQLHALRVTFAVVAFVVALVAAPTVTGAPPVTIPIGLSDHTCIVVNDGRVECWGPNADGQLGDGTTTDRATPVFIAGLTNVRTVTAGDRFSCALTTAGLVSCWGANDLGQLGRSGGASSSSPLMVDGLPGGIVGLAARGEHSCVLTDGGRVACWGWNQFGQLGDGTTIDSTSPVEVGDVAGGTIGIAVGGDHTCALSDAGKMRCWGWNKFGQLGDGTTTNRSTPIDVASLPDGIVAIAAGGAHSCAITAPGGVSCWGRNTVGQLGDGTTTDHPTPVAVNGLTSGIVALALGGNHTCALTSVGGVRCIGANFAGQLGDGTTIASVGPVEVGRLPGTIDAIAAGYFHTCGVTHAGGLMCWGANDVGQLGDGTLTDRSSPVDVRNADGTALIPIGTGADRSAGLPPQALLAAVAGVILFLGSVAALLLRRRSDRTGRRA